MAITYVAVGARAHSSSASSRIPDLPTSRTNGDLLIAVCGSKNNETHTVSGTGWTKLTQVNSGSGWTVSLHICIVNGSETTPTISWTTAVACMAHVIQYRGTSSSPIGATGSNTGSTSTHSKTGVTTTRANSMVIYIDAAAANTALATPTGWTEDNDSGSATGATRDTVGSKTVATQGTASGDISVTGANAAWVMWQIELCLPVTNLTTSSGSFALTGNAASLVKSNKITAASGSYALTGNAVNFSKSITMAAASGSFALVGNAASLLKSSKLTAQVGSFSITDNASPLVKSSVLTATSGSYTVVGYAASLVRLLQLLASPGSYSITGNAAGLMASRLLSALQGSYAMTGDGAGLTASRLLTAANGSYAVTGYDATLTYTPVTGYTLEAESATFSITGNTASLIRNAVINAAPGSFLLTGFAASLSASRVLAAGNGTYTITGNAALLTYVVTDTVEVSVDSAVILEAQIDSITSALEMEIDSGVHTTYLATGSVQLEADANSAVCLSYSVNSEAS